MFPTTHLDLLAKPIPAMLVTLLPDGRPQASVVWFDFVEDVLRVNSERGRLKIRNLERDPRATVLIADPDNQHRYLEIRGDVDSIQEDGALAHRAHLDALYLGPDHRTDPANDRNARVIVSIKPTKVVAYG
jgi:PPOX class probable F420-dependent enzyme